MKKRRLTKQQSRRIAAKQEVPEESSLNQEGLIIAHYGKQLEVEATDGTIYRCFARQNIGELLTGDRVIWKLQSDMNEQNGIIINHHPRKSLLLRPDVYKQQKAIAANISQIMLVIAIEPEPISFYIDQYLMVAAWLDIPTNIVLNKTDLTPDSNKAYELINQYEQIGYRTWSVSAKKTASLSDWRKEFIDHNSILVGQSGVGKSSVLNSLIGKQVAAEGKISTANKKGKHTTTSAKLYHLTTGGNVIDSPGIREFGVWHIPESERDKGFIEFRPFLSKCKFRNCIHLQEPNCAIIAAVEAKKIPLWRWQNYTRILQMQKPN